MWRRIRGRSEALDSLGSCTMNKTTSRLVNACLKFVHEHINEIVVLPIDLNCINNNLLAKLAALFMIEELDSIKEPRDKLLGKLYMKKLEAMLEAKGNMLRQCECCGKLFTERQEKCV